MGFLLGWGFLGGLPPERERPDLFSRPVWFAASRGQRSRSGVQGGGWGLSVRARVFFGVLWCVRV